MDNRNSTVSSSTSDSILQFAPLHSLVDAGFWRRFSNLKLDTLKIDESPISITGFYAPCSNIGVSNHLTLLAESLQPEYNEVSSDIQLSVGNRNKCPVPGTMINTNTLESFVALNKKHMLNIEAKKIYDDIQSGKVEEDCSLLSRFLLISFADLKKWEFKYWFAFPALVLDPPATLINIQPASNLLCVKEAESLSAACDEWRNSSLTTGVPFFVVCISSTSQVTVKSLKDWTCCQSDDQKLLFGFYDPCHAPNNPGWPLRNYLAFICLRWKLKKITFLCYREKHGSADMQSSLIGEALVTVPQGWGDTQCIPKTVGWETNEKGKLGSRNISLAESMDPERLAISAADLNLKLMKWRTLPSLNLDVLSGVKCLLLGAGTLGCQVARMLTGWGFRKMTLLDYGRVAMSNPVRQSLYNFEDSLNGGVLKAHAAVKNLKSILPSLETEGVDLAIPMPGHPVSAQETERIIEDCNKLQALVKSHDVVFLLTDTRESRWLPSLLCAKENKIAITAALGFDSYLVMRHGAGPHISSDIGTISTKTETFCSNEDNQQRLGCYFCNDVVAPIDSTSNRTLDQQCTVTRPGLAPIASALAVELLVGILHHPNGIHAPGEISSSILSRSDQSFGILPHQIRGTISQFSQMMLLGHASNSCTACSDIVVSEYEKRGMEFVLQAINHPTYLEDLTGLTELMNAANTFDVDWDDDAEEADF